MRHLKHAADSFQSTSDKFWKQKGHLVWDVVIKGGLEDLRYVYFSPLDFWNGIPLLNSEAGKLWNTTQKHVNALRV